MLQLITGYWVSRAVFVFAKLGIADHLAAGPRTAADLAGDVGSIRAACTASSRERFGLRRVILVGDRDGEHPNLALLLQREQGYLVGLKRRRNEQVNGYIQAAAQGQWQECPVGIAAPGKTSGRPARW